MSGKKWHWRARVSALHLSTVIPTNHKFRVLFASSLLNLAELVALRPDLACVHSVLYFHENQLQYPVRNHKVRDFQYGYNQILSCLVADCILFNSAFNMNSFLSSIQSFLKLMPDYRPKGLSDTIRPKCSVLYFPMMFHNIDQSLKNDGEEWSPKKKKNDAFDTPEMNHASVQESNTDNHEHLEHAGDQISPDNHNTRAENHTTAISGSSEKSTKDQRLLEDNSTLTQNHTTAISGSSERSTKDQRLLKDNSTLSQSLHQISSVKDGQQYPLLHGSACEGCGIEAASSVKKIPSYGHSKRHHGCKMLGDSCICDVDLLPGKRREDCIHIVWPHRWEHDKDPETFFQTLFRLHEEGLPFKLSVLGEQFTDVPDIFAEAKERLSSHIIAWGYQEKKADYYRVLKMADVVVSTSKHEFFGVAMLEAVYLDCFPLCPKSLVYPEIYAEECLYSTSTQLYKRLRNFCRHPHLARKTSF